MDRNELLKHFRYEPDTGELFWVLPTANRVKKGDRVGYKSSDGYMYFGFKGKTLKVHRAAYLMYYGYLPEQIDHIDHNRINNKIENLRSSSPKDNSRNHTLQKNNTSGQVGVTWSKSRKKWVAMIWNNSKPIYIGRFINKEDAIKARKEAEVKYGYHTNHGRQNPNS